MEKKLTELYGSYTFNDDVMKERLPKETYNRMMNSYSSEYEENKLKIEELKKKRKNESGC